MIIVVTDDKQKIIATAEQEAAINAILNQRRLSDVEVGETFKIGNYEFIRFPSNGDNVIAGMKTCIFNSEFGTNNNYANSYIASKLEKEVLPEIEGLVGAENVCSASLNLLSLDGLDDYGRYSTKIYLPTFDFYRNNVKIFDKYKQDCWWWLSTSYSTKKHLGDKSVCCVSPTGYVDSPNCGDFYYFGVRPFCIFNPNIFVS